MKQIKETILENSRIAYNYYNLSFSWENTSLNPKPGQFVTIRVAETTVPLLRRPFAFSFYNKKNRSASIIYQKRGKGTEILAGKAVGEEIDIIGPLGNYLKVPGVDRKPVLVAGGIGFGPIFFFSNWLFQENIDHTFVFGCKTKDHIPSLNLFTTNDKKIICTDDGSEGFKGTTVDYLLSKKHEDLENTVLYCCGPLPMLVGCHKVAAKHNVNCWVVMEQVMACGVGACMGCTIKVKSKQEFARVCSEGPVFNSIDVVWI